MRGVRECRVRFLEFEVGNENIAVAAVGRERKPALGFPRFPPPAISTAGLAGRMLLLLPATSALGNLSRLSYPHETAKNPFWRAHCGGGDGGRAGRQGRGMGATEGAGVEAAGSAVSNTD